tara:strand:+ start:537 stop:2336 length:1800 start_codon:yes stop_codon:yes gene_type:complete
MKTIINIDYENIVLDNIEDLYICENINDVIGITINEVIKSTILDYNMIEKFVKDNKNIIIITNTDYFNKYKNYFINITKKFSIKCVKTSMIIHINFLNNSINSEIHIGNVNTIEINNQIKYDDKISKLFYNIEENMIIKKSELELLKNKYKDLIKNSYDKNSKDKYINILNVINNSYNSLINHNIVINYKNKINELLDNEVNVKDAEKNNEKNNEKIFNKYSKYFISKYKEDIQKLNNLKKFGKDINKINIKYQKSFKKVLNIDKKLDRIIKISNKIKNINDSEVNIIKEKIKEYLIAISFDYKEEYKHIFKFYSKYKNSNEVNRTNINLAFLLKIKEYIFQIKRKIKLHYIEDIKNNINFDINLINTEIKRVKSKELNKNINDLSNNYNKIFENLIKLKINEDDKELNFLINKINKDNNDINIKLLEDTRILKNYNSKLKEYINRKEIYNIYDKDQMYDNVINKINMKKKEYIQIKNNINEGKFYKLVNKINEYKNKIKLENEYKNNIKLEYEYKNKIKLEIQEEKENNLKKKINNYKKYNTNLERIKINEKNYREYLLNINKNLNDTNKRVVKIINKKRKYYIKDNSFQNTKTLTIW